MEFPVKRYDGSVGKPGHMVLRGVHGNGRVAAVAVMFREIDVLFLPACALD